MNSNAIEHHAKVTAVVGIATQVSDYSAVATIIDSIPRDAGLSFVVLSGNRRGASAIESHLRARGRPTHTAMSGLTLQPDHVYVVPEGSNASLSHATLQLSSQPVGSESFDDFLSALAHDQHARSVGMVLSRVRHHGCGGLLAIERVGGCPVGPLSWGEPIDGGLQELSFERVVNVIPKRVLRHLHKLTGAELPPHETLSPRQPVTGRAHVAASPKLLGGPTQVSELALKLGEASRPFFGDGRIWQRLADNLGPLFDAKPSKAVRAWVPLCGTGQRVYSLAMVLLECAPADTHQLQVFGSDPSSLAIGIARAGRYSRAAIENLSHERRRTYFSEGDDVAQVGPALRHRVLFGLHDVYQAPPLSRIDLLLGGHALRGCPENLLPILLRRFHFALGTRGWLAVGPSEAPLVSEALFEPIDPECGLFRTRTAASPGPRPAAESQAVPGRPVAQSELQALAAELRGVSEQRLEELERLDRALADLKNFVTATQVPACICDTELRLRHASRALTDEFGLPSTETGLALAELATSLPGGFELVNLARAVVDNGTSGQRLEHFEGTLAQVYLVRLMPYLTQRGEVDGVVIVFTDVSNVERARALAAKRASQQAAVAKLGMAALSIPSHKLGSAPVDLYRRALDTIADALGGQRGFVLERSHAENVLLVKAAQGWCDQEGSAHSLIPFGAKTRLARALQANRPLEFEQNDVDSSLTPLLDGFVMKRGFACPLKVGESVFGVLAGFAEVGEPLTSEDVHFVQSVANVLAGTIARQRARRRLFLEREVGILISRAEHVPEVAAGVERALAACLEATNVTICVRSNGRSDRLERVWPKRSERSTDGCQLPSCSDLVATFARSTSPRCRLEVVEGRAHYRLEFPILHGKGIVGVVACSCTQPVAADDELLLGLERVGSSLGDFLHWNRVDAALRESEHRYREQSAELETIYATLPVGLAVHDRTLQPIRTNRRFAELHDAAQQSTLPDEQCLRSVFATAEPMRDVEVTRQAAGGQRSWLCSFAPLRDSTGEVTAVSSVVQDITDLKQMEFALREADRQKNDFLAMLGHELRNPLAAIRNATELLKLLAPEHMDLARVQGVLDRQTRQMSKLIDGLLDVSRVIRGMLTLDRSIVDLGRLLADVVQDRAQDLEQRGIALSVELPHDPLWMDGDRFRLVQVFDNILSNAAKFTDRGGHITVQAGRQDGHAVVHIEDDGIGIEPDLLPHIFEPFRQAKQSSERALGGLGLGLSLVKGLVELHGGSIRAESHGLGTGARFIAKFALSAETGHPTSVPPVHTPALRVLIVEDNVDMADTLAELLALLGHVVLGICRTGTEGIARGAELVPDVVLCDLGLPGGKSGLDVARQLRSALGADVALFAVTGYGDSSSRKSAQLAGFDRCLTKPVTLDTLQRNLARIAVRAG